MAKDDSGLLDRELATFNAQTAAKAAAQLTALVRVDDLVGDLFKTDHASSEVFVDDYFRQKVAGCRLAASPWPRGLRREPHRLRRTRMRG